MKEPSEKYKKVKNLILLLFALAVLIIGSVMVANIVNIKDMLGDIPNKDLSYRYNMCISVMFVLAGAYGIVYASCGLLTCLSAGDDYVVKNDVKIMPKANSKTTDAETHKTVKVTEKRQAEDGELRQLYIMLDNAQSMVDKGIMSKDEYEVFRREKIDSFMKKQ